MKRYRLSRLQELAQPRSVSPYFIPDKISVYWLDYIPDPTPHKITDPYELLEYYYNARKNYPRVEKLAEARPCTYREDTDDRPRTAFGIPVSALNYEATERINRLATPVAREQYRGLMDLPSDSESYSRPFCRASDKYHWFTQNPDLFSKGDFYARSRIRRSRTQNIARANSRNRQPSPGYSQENNPGSSYPSTTNRPVTAVRNEKQIRSRRH